MRSGESNGATDDGGLFTGRKGVFRRSSPRYGLDSPSAPRAANKRPTATAPPTVPRSKLATATCSPIILPLGAQESSRL